MSSEKKTSTSGQIYPSDESGFMKKEHDIIFCTPPENKELFEGYKCPFIAFERNYKELFKQNATFAQILNRSASWWRTQRSKSG